MASSSDAMQQLLMQKLQQNPSAGFAGGGQGGPQMQGSITPQNAAATLMQKAMLVKALQNHAQSQQAQQATAMIPQTQSMMAQNQLQIPTNLPPAPQMQPGAPGVNPSMLAAGTTPQQ